MLQFTSPSNYLRCFLLLSFYSPNICCTFLQPIESLSQEKAAIHQTQNWAFFSPKKNIYTLLDPSAIFWFLFFFVFYRYCSEVTNLKYLQTQENENLMNTFILFAFQICFFVHFIIFSKNRPSSIESHLWTPPTFSRDIMCERIICATNSLGCPFSRTYPKIFLSF